MDLQSRQFIRENAGKKKPEEIARTLGLKERHVRREIERQKEKQKFAAPKQEPCDFSLPKISRLLLIFSLFAIFSVAIYSNTFQASFHFDDIRHIRNSQALHDPSNIPAIWRWSPSRFLPNLTFALNYRWGGENVFGYHMVNITIHVMASFMVYLFILTLFQTPKLRSHALSARANSIALLTGLLFAAHPIQIQAVTYIIQRHASFATLFYVTTCFLYVSSRLKRSAKIRRAAVLFCVAAMFTKEIAFTLPAALLMIEFFLFNDGQFRRIQNCLERLTPFLLTMLIILMPRLHQSFGNQAGHFGETTTITPLHYLFTQFNVIIEYLRLLLWPNGQSLYHAFPISFTLWEPKTLLSLGFLVSLFVAAWVLKKKQPAVSFGLFWFFLTMSVESSFFPIEHVIFEHRMYLPMVGLCLVMSTLLVSVFKNRKILIVISTVILSSLCFVTYQRNATWKTEDSLWRDVVKNYKGTSNHHMFFEENGRGAVEERVENKPFNQWGHEAQ